jgi:hypothetical protein
MPVRIKKLNQKKKMPLPKSKPRLANPKHPMNAEKTKPLGKANGGPLSALDFKRKNRSLKMPPPPPVPSGDFQRLLARGEREKGVSEVPKEFMGTRPMESKAADKKRSRRGSAKSAPSTGMAAGGKLKMVEKGGKKVPFFAADGKGKMAMGGMMKKKGYAKGGAVKVGEKGTAKTLSQIAKQNGVTLKALLGANPSIKNANKIRLGQSIKLPSNMAGSKSSNPYAGIQRGQMADMDVKNKSEKRQRTATRSMQSQVKQGGSRMTPTPSKAAATKESKSGREAMLAKARKLRDSKQAAKPTGKTLANTPKSGAAKVAETRMARLANKNKLARRAGGGMMKKKGMSKGGVMRGTGAATRGKRFGRAG